MVSKTSDNNNTLVHQQQFSSSSSPLSSTQDVHALDRKNVQPPPHEASTEPAKNIQPPSPFDNGTLINVCSSTQGAKVLWATDEWFASADNLLKEGPPVFDSSAFCAEGKVMDGWESRRRREAGHDWCILKLTGRSKIVGVELDTAHFTGNNTPQVSLEIADLSAKQELLLVSGMPGVLERLLSGGGEQGVGHTPEQVQMAEESCGQVEWKELLPVSHLQAGYEATRMHYFSIPAKQGTHVRLNYFPDGGVARLRLWGTPVDESINTKKPLYSPIQTGEICTVIHHKDTTTPPSQQPYKHPELSCSTLGGMGIECSNKHYGHPDNLIQPNLGMDMGDGWETARHPERPAVLRKDPKTDLVDSNLMDWAVIRLGRTAVQGIERIILDTRHFRGNYPESVRVEGSFANSDAVVSSCDTDTWFSLLPRTRMAPDAEHVFDTQKNQIENATRPVTHVRVTIFPDGGLSRVRIYGKAEE